jgi:hypothetical protein
MFEGITRDPGQRARELKAKRDAAMESEKKRTERFRFNNENHDLVVFKVEIGFPFYRIDNGRTHRMQLKMAREHPLGDALFADPISIEAQTAQHEILVGMADEAKLRNSILKESQRDPILLTSDGIVLNGNRRLAVMRALNEDEKSKPYTQVDACLLPPLDETELLRIEMRLQMSNPGKADYHWLDELITIRDNVHEHGMQIKDVADSMGKHAKTIKTFLRRLSLIEDYLETIGKSGELDYIDTLKQAFIDIAEHHMRLDNMPDKQALYKEMAFNLLASPDASKHDSVHKKLEKLSKNFLDAARVYGEMREVGKSPRLSDRVGSDVLEKLSGVSFGDFASVSISPKNAEAVEASIGMAGEKQFAQDEANLPFRNASAANRLLQEIELSEKTTARAQLAGQLNAIVSKAQTLITQLKGMK